MDLIDLRGMLAAGLADWRTGWNVGSFGAIAEFHQDAGEPAEVDDPSRLSRATARGGIRIDRVDGVMPVAWEGLSPRPHRWSHGIALCLPEAEGRRNPARTVLTELGPDEAAIRPQDRGAILFDLGLGQANIDFCVRTRDPGLIAALRAGAGLSVLAPDNPAMAAILPAHPHRVAISAIGRAEVYQKIGGPDTGGVSPPGPHTHLLPRLLGSGRTHAATLPIPDGLIPGASLHPGHPLIGPLGEDRPFEPALLAAFGRLHDAFGTPEAIATKRAVVAALDAGTGPAAFDAPTARHARIALRVALRQQAQLRGEDGLLRDWIAAFDRPRDDTDLTPEQTADPGQSH